MKTASELENIIMVKELKIKQQNLEIERLKQGYCELKEKCNKGECDCTHEEYNSMCEANIELINRIDKAIEYIEKYLCPDNVFELNGEEFILLQILRGDN